MQGSSMTREQLLEKLALSRRRVAQLEAKLLGFQEAEGVTSRLANDAETSGAFASTLFDSISDMITVQDTEYNVIRVNRAVEKAYGKGVLGRKCYQVYQGRATVCPGCAMARALATGEPAFSDHQVGLQGRFVEIWAYPVRDAGGKIIAVLEHGKDVTERKRAEVESAESSRCASALHKVSLALAGSMELDPLSRLALREALGATALDAGVVRCMDGSNGDLVLMATLGLSRELEAKMGTMAGRIKVGQGLAGAAGLEKKPLVVENIANDKRCLVPDLAAHGFSSAVYVPLRSNSELVGVISGYSRQPRAFNDSDLVLLDSLGVMVGMAMANARLFDQVQAKGKDWRETFDAMTDGVAIIGPDQRILRANWALARLVGATPKDLIGKRCYEVVHGSLCAPEGCPANRCLMEKQPCELVREEANLGKRWLQLRIDPVLGAGGEVLRMVHIFKDITAEKRHEAVEKRLHELSKALSSTLDLDQVVQLAIDGIGDTFGAASSALGMALLDEWRQQFNIAYIRGPHQELLKGRSLPLNLLLPEALQTLLKEHRPWLQADIFRSSQALKDLPGFLEHRSFIAVPMVSGDQTIGVLFLARGEPGLPSKEDIALLETFAREIALAVQNAQLFGRTNAALRRRIAQQEALMGVLATAGSSLDIEATLQEALAKAAAALEAERASVLAFDDSGQLATGLAEYQAGANEPMGGKLALQVAEHPWLQDILRYKRFTTVEDVAGIPEGNEKELLSRLGVKSAIRLPIVARGNVIGTLQFGNLSGRRSFSQEEVSLALAFANHLASAMENARLYRRTEKERRTLESIIESMGEGLTVSDNQGRVLYVNRAAESIFNMNSGDLIGKQGQEFEFGLGLRSISPQETMAKVEEAMKRLEQRPKVESDIVSGSGTRSIEMTLFLVGDKGDPLGTGAILRDVTREREVDRMKTEFISTVSHELRTPMTVVYGFADLLLTKSNDIPEQQREWVNLIYKESKRLVDIVEDLLDVSRIEAGRLSLNLAPLAVAPLAAQVVQQLQFGHPAHHLGLDISVNLPPVLCDKDKLQQVLYNLVDNAIKYSPAGGPVTIAARLGDEEGKVELSVSDRGLGIVQEDIPRLFGRFQRMSRTETAGIRGTGLGLYIVKRLVEMMGGSIRVESRLGEGSTFLFSLPTAAAQSSTL